ncbi:hypothetical protein FRC15_005905 [Serendipita sp. 397]|nr:hypothetical protein FRC15_005905 [Serendipita sp. 397]KAG8798919.1 hypothetical protein FRC16_006241 [Serendipita sp. 398]
MANPIRQQVIVHELQTSRRDDPSTAHSRSCAQQYLRSYPAPIHHSENTLPRMPHLSWLYDRHVLLGLNHDALPRAVDLRTPRVGRVFCYSTYVKDPTGSLRGRDIPIAMFGACSSLTSIPPYPGVPPKFSSTPNSTISCHIDGTYGAYDGRRYPQLVNPRSLWMVFHDSVASLSYNPTSCEVNSPNDFFYWNHPGDPSRDGSWIHRRLLDLFTRREVVESEFARLVELAAKFYGLSRFNDSAQRHAVYDLPYYDPISFSDALMWRSWTDGFGSLSYTLQYVAGMKALNRWLQAQIDSQKFGWTEWEVEKPDPLLMGGWASTITQHDDWLFLMRFRVPIYIITQLPLEHPLLTRLQLGNLDADERYRSNAFDSQHRLEPYWLTHYQHLHSFVPGLRLECRSEYIPQEILDTPLHPIPANSTATSCLLTWKSPIYRHDISRLNVDMLELQRKTAAARRSIDELFPVTLLELRADVDRHPLLDAIGNQFARDGNRMIRFIEEFDAENDAYYPRRLGHKTSGAKSAIAGAFYRWCYLTEKIEIFSDFPFPGRSSSFGRVLHDLEDDDSDDNGIDSDANDPRRYYRSKPKPNEEPRFIWQPTASLKVQSHHRGSARVALDTTPVPPSNEQFIAVDDPMSKILWEQRWQKACRGQEWAMASQEQLASPGLFNDYIKELVSLENPSKEDSFWTIVRIHARRLATQHETVSPFPFPRCTDTTIDSVKTLLENRTLLQEQLKRRLFRPVGGDNTVSERPIPWHITGGSSQDICYPLRISGIHGDASPSVVFALLESTLGIRQHDVVIFSSSREVDTTLSFDFGLRYCEDALLISILLHGVEVDDRLLEVQFLHAMSKKISIICLPGAAALRTPQERLSRVWGMLAQPGIDDKLVGHAYQLWKDLSSSFLSSSAVTPEHLMTVKETQVAVQNVLTSTPSLLAPDEYTNYNRPLLTTQELSLGSADPAPVTMSRLFYHFAMAHQFHLPSSLARSGRPDGARTKNARKNAKKHQRHPELIASSTMSSEQRASLKKAIIDRTRYLQTCWRPESLLLPPFNSNIPSGVHEEAALIQFYTDLWDWQDQCLDIM